MDNKKLIMPAVPVLMIIIGFFAKEMAAGKAVEEINYFVDLVPMDSIVTLTAKNKQSLDILKNGKFDFEQENLLAGLEPGKLAKYFRPYEKAATEGDKKAAGGEKAAVTKKAKSKNSKNKISGAPVYSVSSVYLGQNINYIVLDGHLLKTGDKTPSGEKILLISKKRIKLQGRWGTRWITVN